MDMNSRKMYAMCTVCDLTADNANQQLAIGGAVVVRRMKLGL